MGMLLRRYHTTQQELESLLIDELQVLAKEKGIKGISKLSKEALAEKLKGTES